MHKTILLLFILTLLSSCGPRQPALPTSTIQISTASPSLTPFPTNTQLSTAPTIPSPTSTQISISVFPVLAGNPVPHPSAKIGPGNAAHVLELAQWGRSDAQKLVFSSDDRYLAVATSAGAYLYDATTLKQLYVIDPQDWLGSVAFSPDGKVLATGSDEGSIKLWEVDTGHEMHVLKGHNNIVSSLAFSPDGKILASGAWDSLANLWDVDTGERLNTLLAGSIYVDFDQINTVAFSPDGKDLVTSSSSGLIKLWDVATGRRLGVLSEHASNQTNVAFSPDGKKLIFQGDDRSIHILDTTTGVTAYTINDYPNWDIINYSPDGQLLSTVSSAQICTWNANTGEKLTTQALGGQDENISDVAFSSDWKRMAIISGMDQIQLWDVATGQELSSESRAPNWDDSLAFSPNGKILATGSGDPDNAIKLWDVTSGQELSVLTGHTNMVTSVAFSPNGALLVSGAEDATVRLWNIATGENVCTMRESSWVNGVAFSPDGHMVVSGNGDWMTSGSDDMSVKLWDAATCNVLYTLNGHTDSVTSVAFSPDGKMVASGSADMTIKLWDAGTGKEIRSLNWLSGGVTSVTFSPDGKILASGSTDGTIKLWNIESGKVLRILTKQTSDPVTSVSFSPDGNILASSSGKYTGEGVVGLPYGEIELWDMTTGQELNTIKGDPDVVTDITFAPDGYLLASASEDGTIRLWGVAP